MELFAMEQHSVVQITFIDLWAQNLPPEVSLK